ncbi:MAG: hypothetical protein ACO4AI_03810 [Prochlorothrix sp.]|nr:hypothetical protein [Prochlorothrix sp.]
MYSLNQFKLADMTSCGSALRKLGQNATHMEAAAQNLTQYLYRSFRDPYTQETELALVRVFKTHPYGHLPPGLQTLARATIAPTPPTDALRCLTLLSTTGDQPEWNDRTQSQDHQVIPLTSVQMVHQVPMIAQLITQLGLAIEHVVTPDPALIMDLQERTYNVFHIPQALGSPYIPAQTEFVQPYGIESVLGFGGILPSGSLLVIILFSKSPISRTTAEFFKTLALNAKMAVFPLDQPQIFSPAPNAKP